MLGKLRARGRRWGNAGCALALWLSLAGCGGPTLTLAARSSLRARRGGAVHAQLWTAAASLGWKTEALAAGARSPLARESETFALQASDAAALNGTPCVLARACDWETEQRKAALVSAAREDHEERR